MNPGPDPGRIVVAFVWRDGRIEDVAIRSMRPRWPVRALTGRDPREVPRLARLLFGVCGASHEAAARLALAAAGAFPLPPLDGLTLAILAERFGSLARSELLGRAASPGEESQATAALRAYVSAERSLGPRMSSGADLASCANALAAAARSLRAPLEAAIRAALPPGPLVTDSAAAPDSLVPADDEQVAGLLASNPEEFGPAPSLPGRVVETGPHARQATATRERGEAEARLASRLEDMEATARALGEWRPAATADPGNLAFGSPGAGEGWSAVETGRGRLHHWVALGRDGSVVRYAIAAPTEWNFHPRGPLARCLEGRAAGTPEAALADARRLALLFDSCVPCEVSMGHARHA